MNISIGNLGGSNTSVSTLISQLVSKRTQSLNTLLDQKASIENTIASLSNSGLGVGSINSSYSSQIASLQDTIDRMNEQYSINANKITAINSLKKSYASTVTSLDKYLESLKNPNSEDKDLDIYLNGDKVSSNDKVNVTVNDKNTNVQEITLNVQQIATTSILKSNTIYGGNVTKNTKITDLFAGIFDSSNNSIKTNRQDLKESLKLSDLGVTSGSFNLGSATIQVDAENDTVGSLIQKIKAAGYNASIEISDYDSNGEGIGRLVISGSVGQSIAITSQTSNFGSLMGLTVSEGNFYINGAEFKITSSTTLGSLMDDINAASADNVGAKLEDGKLVFVASETGAVDINVEKGTSNFTNAIGFTVGGVMDTSNLVLGTDGSYVTLTGQNKVDSNDTAGSANKFTEGNFTVSFNKIDAHGNVLDEMQTVTIEITNGMTIDDIAKQIEQKTKGSYVDTEGNTIQTGLTAYVDGTGHFVIRQTQKGAEYNISVEAGTSNFTNYVGMTSSVSNTVSTDADNSYIIGTTQVPNSGFTEGSFTITTNKVSDDGKTALFETITATIDVTTSDTKESIAQKINDANIGLTASITADGYFKIEQVNAGADFDIKIQAGATNFTEKAGLTSNVINTGVLSPGSSVNQYSSLTGTKNVTGNTAVSAGSFMINGVTVTFADGNINSAIDAINAKTDETGVNAYLKDGKVVLQANKTGPDYSIYIEGGTSDFGSVAGFISESQSAATATVGKVGEKTTLTGATGVSANDSITAGTIKINGVEIELEDGTLANAVNKINEYSAQTGVTAAITNGKLVFTNINKGDESISIESGSSNFAQVTGTAAYQTTIGNIELVGGSYTTLTGSVTGLGPNTPITESVIKINGQDIRVSGSINSAINSINANSGFTGVVAALDDEGRLVFTNTKVGTKAITLSSVSGDFVTNYVGTPNQVLGTDSKAQVSGSNQIKPGNEYIEYTTTVKSNYYIYNYTSSEKFTSGSITVKGQKFDATGKTLQDMVNAINSAGIGVTAELVSGTDSEGRAYKTLQLVSKARTEDDSKFTVSAEGDFARVVGFGPYSSSTSTTSKVTIDDGTAPTDGLFHISKEDALAQGYTVIETAQDLQNALATITQNNKYILMNDIDLSGLPIPTTSLSSGVIFDGNNYTISNLGTTLFQGIDSGATLQNLFLEDVDTTLATIVETNSGTIRNVHVLSGSVAGGSAYSGATKTVGGLVHENTSTGLIDQSSFNGSIDNTANAAGIAWTNQGIISNTFVKGTIDATSSAAGMVTNMYGGTISNSYVSADVKVNGSSSGTTVGALVGTHGAGTIENTFWDAEKSNSSSYATFVHGAGSTTNVIRTSMSQTPSSFYTSAGWNTYIWDFSEDTPILKSMMRSSSSNIEPSNFVRMTEEEAIAAGYTVIKTAQDLQNIANNMSGKYVLMGDIDLSGINWTSLGAYDNPFEGELYGNGYTIKNLNITGSADGYYGFFASTYGANIHNLCLENVAILAESGTAGAIAGDADGGTSINNVHIKNINIVGNVGTAGAILGKMTDSNILASSVTGNSYIHSLNNAGGLVGSASMSIIDSSYVADTVVEGVNVGGIIGSSTSSTVNESYYTGMLSASSYTAGGIIGYSDYQSHITDSFWENTCATSGVGSHNSGAASSVINNSYGKTLTELQDPTTFADWDTSVWMFNSGSTPTLVFQEIFNIPDTETPSTSTIEVERVTGGATITDGMLNDGYISQDANSTQSVTISYQDTDGTKNISFTVNNGDSLNSIMQEFNNTYGEFFKMEVIDGKLTITGQKEDISNIEISSTGDFATFYGLSKTSHNWNWSESQGGMTTTTTSQVVHGGGGSSNNGIVIGSNDISASGSDSEMIQGMGKPIVPNNGYVSGSFDITEEQAIAAGYIVIKTAQDLLNISNNLAGKYILMNDIDLSGMNWVGIGTKGNGFSGTLDGNGHTIKNLTIKDADSTEASGLFAYTKGSASIKNLVLSGVNIEGGKNTGALIGVAEEKSGYLSTPKITNVHIISGSIKSNGSYLGGLIGSDISDGVNIFDTSVSNISIGSKNGSSNNVAVGGLIGYEDAYFIAMNTIVDINNWTVSGSNVFVGGFVGSMGNYSGGRVENSISKVNFNSISSTRKGTLVGSFTTHLTTSSNSLYVENVLSLDSASTSTQHIGYKSGAIEYTVQGYNLTTAPNSNTLSTLEANGWDVSTWKAGTAEEGYITYDLNAGFRCGLFIINGVQISGAGKLPEMVIKINEYTLETGVVASIENGKIVLENADGSDRFISVAGDGATRMGIAVTEYKIEGSNNVSSSTQISAGTVVINGSSFQISGGSLSSVLSELDTKLGDGYDLALENGKVVIKNNLSVDKQYLSIIAGTSNFVDVTGTSTMSTGKLSENQAKSLGYTIIKTANDLKNIGNNMSGKYILMGDIDLSGINWNMIGTELGNLVFSGELNGNGYTIKGLTLRDNVQGGLFSQLNRAVITNLSIENATLSNICSGGILAAIASGSYISNVHVQGTIVASGDCIVGGLVGLLGSSTFVNSSADVQINSTTSSAPVNQAYAGGLFGWAVDSYISNCLATGSINLPNNVTSGVSGLYAGGLVGLYSSSNMTAGIVNSIALVSLNFTNSSSEQVHPRGSLIGMVGSLGAFNVFENNYSLSSSGVFDVVGDNQSGMTLTNVSKELNLAQSQNSSSYSGLDANIWDLSGTKPKLKKTLADAQSSGGSSYVSVTTGTIKINGQSVSITSTDLAVAIEQINSQSDKTGVVATIENNKVVFRNSDGGSNNITIESGTSNFVNVTGTKTETQNSSSGNNIYSNNGVTIGDQVVTEVSHLSESDALSQGYTIIKTAQDLQNIKNNLSGKYILMNDIDLSSISNWTSIGSSSAAFKGELNGNGYTISNLNISESSQTQNGLFGYTNGAIIKNLFIDNANVDINTTSGGAGIVVGQATNSTISNVHVSNSSVSSVSAGLIAGGLVDSTIELSSSSGTVDARYAGGIVGTCVSGNSTINNSYSTANILSSAISGGIVGFVKTEANISNVYFDGELAGGSSSIGAIVGSSYGTSFNSVYWNSDKISFDAVGYSNHSITNVAGVSESELYNSDLVGFDYDFMWVKNENSAPTLATNVMNISKGTLVINNQTIHIDGGHIYSVIEQINSYSSTTGVVASINSEGKVMFQNADASNTNITISAGTSDFVEKTGTATTLTNGDGGTGDTPTILKGNKDVTENDIIGKVTLEFGKDGTEYTVSTTSDAATLKDLINLINAKTSESGIFAEIVDGKFTLSRVSEGSNPIYSDISIGSSTGIFGAVTGLDSSTAFGLKGQVTGSTQFVLPTDVIISEEQAVAQGYTVIKTAQDLQNIKNNLSGKYILMADINLSGFSWTAIGTSSSAFTGELNGNGFTISNLSISKSTTSYQGLFGYTKNAKLKNITLSSVNVSGKEYVGGLVGYAYGTNIQNVKVSGNVTASDTKAGAVVGAAYSSTSISNVTTNGSISARVTAGGIVGDFQNSSLSYAYSSANITSSGSVGGLVGYAYYSTINVVEHSSGTITGNASSGGTNTLGGIVGSADVGTNVSNAYTYNTKFKTTTSSATTRVGGIAGFAKFSTIGKSVARIGGMTGTFTYKGGIVGLADTQKPTLQSNYFLKAYATNAVGSGSMSSTSSSNTAMTSSQMNVGTNFSLLGGTYWNKTSSSISLNYQGYKVLDSNIKKQDGTAANITTGTMYINGVTVSLYAGNLKDAITKINTYTSQTGVVVSINNKGNVVFKYADGEEKPIIISAGTSNFVEMTGTSTTSVSSTDTVEADFTKINGTQGVANEEEASHISREEAIAQGYTIIDTVEDLINTQNNPSGKYILMGDLDLSGYDWTSLSATSSEYYTAIIEGNNYTIKNLTGGALFAGVYGEIRNLKIDNANVESGAIFASSNYGTVENIYITNSTISNSSYAAGFIAANNGTISNVHITNTTVNSTGTSASVAVGLVYYNYGNIKNSSFTGNIISNDIAAGLVYTGADIENSYFKGSIQGAKVGGLSYYAGTIINSYVSATMLDTNGNEITAGSGIAGAISYLSGGNITNSFWDISKTQVNTAFAAADSDGANGLTESQFGDSSIFTNAGWDTDIWDLSGKTPMLIGSGITDPKDPTVADTIISPEYEGTFTISSTTGESVSINVTSGMTVQDILDAINSDGDYHAEINEEDKIVITSVNGGVTNITFGGTSNLEDYFGLTSSSITIGNPNFSIDTGFDDEYSTLTGQNNVTSNMTFSAGDFSITVDGNTVTFDVLEGESLNSILNKINSSDVGVIASVQDGKLVLTSKTPGAVDISLNDGTSNFAEITGFVGAGGVQLSGVVKGVLSTYTSANTAQSAQNAGISAGDFFVHLTDINGNITDTVKIEVSKNESIASIIDKINNSGLGVTASINDSGKMVITRNSSETAGGVLVTQGSSDFTNKIGFTSGGYQSAVTQYGSSTSLVSSNSVSTSKRFNAGNFIIGVEDQGVYKEYEIDVSATDSILDVIDKINKADIGVTASLNSNNKLVLTKDSDTGEGSITVKKGSSDFTTVLGFSSGGIFNGSLDNGEAATHTVLVSNKLAVSGKATMASLGINSGSFRINGVEIAIKETDTIEDVIGRINSVFNNSKYNDIGVSAEYKNNQIVLTSKKASSDARIEIESGSTNFTEVVGFTDLASRNNVVDMGQNAKFNIKIGNGPGKDYNVALDLKDITNDNIYNGNNLIYLDANGKVVSSANNAAITIEIKQTGETVIKIGQNLLDASINELNKFIGYFNKSMIMSENEILSDDAEFATLINNIKAALTDDVADIRKIQQELSEIGITVDIRGGENSNMGTVRLYLDKEKYTKAFYADSQHVMDLLVGKETVIGVEDGVLTRLNNVLFPEVNNKNGYFNKVPRQLEAIQKQLKREITSTTFDLNELKLAVAGTPSTDGLSEYLAQLEEQYRYINEAIDNLNKQYASSVTRLILNQNNSGFNPII